MRPRTPLLALAFAFAFAFALLLPGCSQTQRSSATGNQPADPPTNEPAWQSLLTDGDLNAHWRGYRQPDAPAGWSAQGNTVTRTDAAGDLITRERFTNVEFAFEFQVRDRSNSGVFFWVQELDAHPAYRSAPEFQVLDNPGWSYDWDDLHAVGASYALYPCTVDATRPAGEWNTARLVIQDGRVEHHLNGQLVCAYTVGSDDWNQRVAESKFNDWPEFAAVREGHLGLQDHGDWVAYRNLRVRRLD